MFLDHLVSFHPPGGIPAELAAAVKFRAFLGGSVNLIIAESFAIETGWWFKPLWKILVNWDDYSQYMGK